MRISIVLSIILLTACSSLSSELQKAIAFGSITELNQLSPEVDKQLLLRIYESPSYQKGCFNETHGVCQYIYFLSVSTFDEYPETKIYELKTKGEIIKIDWQNEAKTDSAKILMVFNKFTREALKNNKSLGGEEEIVCIEVNAISIRESTAVLTNNSRRCPATQGAF